MVVGQPGKNRQIALKHKLLWLRPSVHKGSIENKGNSLARYNDNYGICRFLASNTDRSSPKVLLLSLA
jgi:hypothetical protein